MKISKKDALNWYRFFSQLPEEEPLGPQQQEIALSVLSQIEASVEAANRALLDNIPGLQTLQGRTFYVGDSRLFPRGCISCLTGTGLSAVRKTNRCNLNCRFCYDYGEIHRIPPIGEGYWEIGGTRFRLEDMDLLLSASRRPTGVAYVYLEPFMEIDLYPPMIRRFAEAGIHQHMSTNGTLANEQNLRELAEAGLPEIRFNLGASGCSDQVIENIRIACGLFERVGIETPMTPELHAQFMKKKDRILSTGVQFINFAELHLGPGNVGNYAGEPMYMYRMGYLSPIWSRQLTLKTMRQAALEAWPCVVHDCSNHTKFARDLNLRAKEGAWFGASSYGSEFESIPYELFLPVLEDENFRFLEEEEMSGFGMGDIIL